MPSIPVNNNARESASTPRPVSGVEVRSSGTFSMPAIDDTPVITGPRLRQAIARQRSRNARVLSWVRAVGAVALAAVFVVYRNVSEWQDGVWLAAPYACIAIALAVDEPERP